MPRHHTVRGAALTLGGMVSDALTRVVLVRCRMSDYMLEEIFERMDGCDDASNDISDPDNCLSYGELKTFYGVYCSHFTAENTTDVTRVSLDFRMLPGSCYEEAVELQPRDFRVGEYYSSCARNPVTGRFEMATRGAPYWRHGFPHTNR